MVIDPERYPYKGLFNLVMYRDGRYEIHNLITNEIVAQGKESGKTSAKKAAEKYATDNGGISYVRSGKVIELYKRTEVIKELRKKIGFSPSARGWCYQLESEGYITKDEFGEAAGILNDCIKKGMLPVDIVTPDEGRDFSGVELPNKNTPAQQLKKNIEYVRDSDTINYTPDWWDGEPYYIQMLVEKVDLVTLFEPVCKQYHIPIATSKGWSSILQRATYAKRFKEAESKGLKCVLLYCGDHDPTGLQISDYIKSNLKDLENIVWEYGGTGYNPDSLVVDRFGLNYDFIEEHKLLWIDGLMTGGGKNLADPKHPDHNKSYVQDYLKKFGARKCEANAIVPHYKLAIGLVESGIQKYVGPDAKERFAAKTDAVVNKIQFIKEKIQLEETLQKLIEQLDEEY